MILAGAYWYGGNAPGTKGFGRPESRLQSQEQSSSSGQEDSTDSAGGEGGSEEQTDATGQKIDTGDITGKGNESGEYPDAAGQEMPDKTGESSTRTEDNSRDNNNGLTGNQDAQDLTSEQEPGTDTQAASGNSTEEPTTGTDAENGKKPDETDNPATENQKPQDGENTNNTDTGNSGKDNTDGTKIEGPTETPTEAPVETTYTCTISINCSNILNNWDLFDKSKSSCVPSGGWILKETQVEFKKGDTVFDVLKDITKKRGIQLEYSFTALYGSYYIEGINNLYEFDCGELSGWEYCVNGKFPAFGCSKYVLQDGDKIEWKYTCDLGADVGNPYYK